MSKHLVLGPNATIENMVKKGQAIQVGDTLINYENLIKKMLSMT